MPCEAPGPEEIRSGSSLKEEGKSRHAPQQESTAKTTRALFMDKKTRSCCFNFGAVKEWPRIDSRAMTSPAGGEWFGVADEKKNVWEMIVR